MEDLANLLKNMGSLPFLFIGSGLTKRYLNTPTWEELLKKIAARTEIPYAKFKLSARSKVDPDIREESNFFYAAIASEIEVAYNDCFFIKSNDFFQKKYSELESYFEDDDFNPFKYEISRIMTEAVDSFDINSISKNPELSALSRISSHNIAGIITTNYDTFLEKYFFNNYDVLIGNRNILVRDIIGIDEFYKIHGCSSIPSSIIINSDDYYNYNSKQTYLAAKMLTTFIEHPIIFIGFGLKDPNIDSFLKSITNALDDIQLIQLADRLILIEWDETISDYSAGSYNFNGLQIKKFVLSDFTLLYKTLYENRATYSPMVYKRFKKSIFEIVRTNKPSDTIEVSSEVLDSDGNGKYVIGFPKGVSNSSELPELGLTGFTFYHFFEDLLFNTHDIVNRLSGKELLYAIYNAGYQRNYNLPLFKYANLFGDQLNDQMFLGIKNTLKTRKEKISISRISQIHLSKVNLQFDELIQIDTLPIKQLFMILSTKLLNSPTKSEQDKIIQFCIDNFNEISKNNGTEFRKLLICLDYVLYK